MTSRPLTPWHGSLPPAQEGPITQESPPLGRAKIYRDTGFFRERRAPHLPLPETIREINWGTGNGKCFSFEDPSPVLVPQLGMVAVYGGSVQIADALNLIALRKRLRGRVHVPEVYGWIEDGEQVFIYMELIEGDKLVDRWVDMTGGERRAVLAELRQAVEAIRSLEHGEPAQYIGAMNRRPLFDRLIGNDTEAAGPFLGSDAVQAFHNACDIEFEGDIEVVFTHGNLNPENIILTPGHQPNLAGIRDWRQCGWFPKQWEHCKARQGASLPSVLEARMHDEWLEECLPEILGDLDDDYFQQFLHFLLTRPAVPEEIVPEDKEKEE